MFLPFLFLVLSTTRVALGHMEMIFPYPINSKYDAQVPEADKDYSMTSPLNADGSNYPCKGYNTAANINGYKATATINVGEVFTVRLIGPENHGGGSCQISLSYDNGAQFAVIASYEGGCPLNTDLTFTLPNVPNKHHALLSWSWLNLEGNREFYQNCAIVNIVGGTVDRFTGPRIYRANTYGSECVTIEGVELKYPHPGPQIIFGGGLGHTSPVTQLANCPIDYYANDVLTAGET